MSEIHVTHPGISSLPSTGTPTGKVGVWWFLASEIPVFGGLIGSYIVVRLGSSGWEEASSQLSFTLALVNTLVLLTSSMTMVLAFDAVERKDVRKVQNHLLITILLGLAFLVIKAFEYSGKITHGLTPSAGIFWSFYYGMTGLHALHVLAGVVVNAILYIESLGNVLKPNEHRIELAGLYWHFVDVVWIFLFPLLYLS
jgi:heme/copper-type cytochrome/quinol oxidase subunit 3